MSEDAAPPGESAPGAAAVDAGDLPVGGGLLALVRPLLDRVPPGTAVAVLSREPGVREDLPSWCRLARHDYLGCTREVDHDVHLVRRGPHPAYRMVDAASPDPGTGFATRGSLSESGGPAYPFPLLSPGVALPGAAALYAQAAAAPWNPATDIRWQDIPHRPGPLEDAVAQLMAFLAENELSALYVPARFLPRLHPAHLEVAQFLASQIADEARHVEAFLRRARAGGGATPRAAAVTSWSLLSLLQLEDFAEASFLLSVLGEGTFLDLLRFIEDHAPDEPTRDLVARARADETRHVHFGMDHARHGLAREPGLAARLEAAVERRSATLAHAGGVPEPVADALTVLAGGGAAPDAIARGHRAYRALIDTMADARVRRLTSVGFSQEQAERLSGLHTANFM